MIKRIFCLGFSIILMFTVLCTGTFAFQPSDFELSAEAAMLVSLDTGKTLYSKNADKKMYPASLTKMMTALLLIENTKDLQTETLTVSKNAIFILSGTGSTMGSLKEGEQVSAIDMLHLMLMISAGDAANAIAEHVGGNIEGFVAMMNKRAEELGMNSTHFANAHGLYDDNHYTTASDLAVLAKKVLEYPAFSEVVAKKRYTVSATNKNSARTLSNTNMLVDNTTEYYYKYATGIKTGFIDEAGRCLASTAKKNGYTYLAILLKCPEYGVNSAGGRYRVEFGEAKKLFEWAFNEFEYKSILDVNTVVGEAPVGLSWDTDYVSLVPKTTFSAVMPKKADNSTVSLDIKLNADKFDAPVKKGESMGTVTIMYAGESLGEVEVVANGDVEKSQIMLVMRIAKDIIKSPAAKLVLIVIIAAIAIFIIYCIILNYRHRAGKGKVHKDKRY